MLPFRFRSREGRSLFIYLIQWGALGVAVGALSGTTSAIFLYALDAAIHLRDVYPYLLFGLPIAGLAISFLYERFGKSVAAGNNLLLDQIHSGTEAAIPFRMAPLILIGTVVTHLFGGSAGREGSAVQMGGALGNATASAFRLSGRDRRILIMSGISGGFGSVFGIPLAGTLFGLEVMSIGQIDYEALLPCFAASAVGNAVCLAWGIHHHAYSVGVAVPPLTPERVGLVIVAALLFGGTAAVFSEATEAVSHLMKRYVPSSLLRPVVGGAIVIALTYLVGSRAYLGLSLPLIAQSFAPGGVVWWAFALKIVFTAVTLGSGFKGGEVTPLFCIGATLGAAFGHLTGQPTAYFAGLGLASVFAAAANTPIACVLMGIEMFGGEMAMPLMLACITAYIVSGHRGIYPAQRVGVAKNRDPDVAPGTALRDL